MFQILLLFIYIHIFVVVLVVVGIEAGKMYKSRIDVESGSGVAV